jgi:exodeoxyribonuclease VII large subunit
VDPYAILGPAAQRIDSARQRLARALPQRITRDGERVRYARERLRRLGPRITERAGAAVGLAAARLEDLSPLAILARGYSASFGGDGRTVIRSVSQVAPGDEMYVRVSDGRIRCAVTDTLDGEHDG